MKVLIFAIDIMPAKGRRTSGGSLRTAQIADQFARHGNDVVVAQPRDSRLVRLQMRTLTDSEARCLYHGGNQLEIIRASRPDVIVWAWPLVAQVPIQAGRHVISVVDLNGFQNVEGSAFGGESKSKTTRALLERAAKADHIIYGSSEQKCYWSGIADLSDVSLTGKGWILPFYYCCGHQRSYKLGDPDFHYTGSLLPWLRTQSFLETLARQLEVNNRGRLRLITHSEPSSPNHGAVSDFLGTLRSNRRVQIGAPCGADELFADIAFSGIGLDLSEYSFEREFALPIRTISYLAHGIPVLVNDYSRIAKDIVENEAGWAISAKPERFGKAMRAWLDKLSPAEAERRSGNAARLARNAFAFDAGWAEFVQFLETTSPHSVEPLHSPTPKPAIGRHAGLNVLVISDDFDNIQRLRVHAPFRELQNRGIVRSYSIFGKKGLTFHQGIASDATIDRVWVQRAPIVSISGILDLTGGRLNYDIDDNLLLSPSYRPPIPPGVRQSVRLLLATASSVTVAMPGLVSGLVKHGGIDLVGRTTVAANLLIRGRGRRQFSEPPNSLLVGSSDFLAIGNSGPEIFKAIRYIVRRHDMRVVYVGSAPHQVRELLRDASGKFVEHPMLPYSEYLDFLENSNSIGIVPMDDRLDPVSADFVRGKSDIKAVEFLGMGLPSVFSDVGPYSWSDLTIPLLADNTADCWEDRLEQALATPPQIRAETAREIESQRGLASAALDNWGNALLASVAPPPMTLSRWTTTFEKLGVLLGRQDIPEPFFDAEFYLQKNPDVRARLESGKITAWEHFMRHGRAEGRAASPFDSVVPVQESIDRMVGLTLQADHEMNAIDAEIAALKKQLPA